MPTDYKTTDTELTSIANAIRTKGGTSASLVYPTGFVSAINDISTGGTMVTVTIVSALAGLSNIKICPSASIYQDPETYNMVVTTPQYSLICGLSIVGSASADGVTYEVTQVSRTPTTYLYAIYVGETNGSISI
jgi:hypothetical protein